MNVTPEAKDVLKDMLEQVTDDEQVGIRLVLAVPPEGAEEEEVALGLMLDHPGDQDQVVEHGGRKILILDSTMAQLLTEDTLAAVNTDEGLRLTVERKAA